MTKDLKRRRPTSRTRDPVTWYAQQVGKGAIIAGPHVRDACARHLRDLADGRARGLTWRPSMAKRAIGFFRDVLHLNGGEYEGVPFEPLHWQQFVIGSLHGWMGADGTRRFRVAYVETAKGPLALDTPVATPSGWATMGELRPGDYVFDDQGRPTLVTGVSDVFENRDCYRLTFSDGEQIVADAEHRWNTAALRNGMRPGPRVGDSIRKGGYARRTTAQVADTLKMKESTSLHPQAKWNHRVDVAPALCLAAVDLPIPPYTLGAWLGDGDRDSARLTVAYADWQTVDEIALDGFAVREQVKHSETTARVLIGSGGRTQAARDSSLQAKMREIGVLGNKHIPTQYFRAGTLQRLDLLQGLMDTDGSVSPGGKCEITLCDERLSRDSLALIRGLGFKAEMRESDAKIDGRIVGRRWRIGFQAYVSMPPFRLARKAERLGKEPKTRALSRGRMIVGCDRVASVPVKCITVAAESHMFLAGHALVPTCNSGKSPLAAGLGMHGLIGDKESRAEVYAAATKKDQAMVLFRDAVAMYQQSPLLHQILTASGRGEKVWNLAYHREMSFFRPISADDGQSGPRPSVALIDELHEHKSNMVFEMMRAGTKSRRQALIFAITNSGNDKHGPCWQYHTYAAQVCAGVRKDDSFFGYVCANDEGDDPIHDEAVWPKTNPSLQQANLPGLKYLREQVIEARGMPAKESLVRRLNFCEWTESANPWIGVDVWMDAARTYDWRDLAGRRAWGGLDLSSTQDLTALVLWIEPQAEGEPWHLVPFCWLPDANLADKADKDNVPYLEWKAAGLLETTPGAAVSKLHVAKRVAALAEVFDVQAVAFDRWRIEDFLALANDHAITLPPMVPFGQGYKDMSPALEATETHLLNGTVVHPSHPVLTWCAANAIADTDPAGNRKLSKDKATGRIDLMVATVMGGGLVSRLEARENIDQFLNAPLVV